MSSIESIKLQLWLVLCCWFWWISLRVFVIFIECQMLSPPTLHIVKAVSKEKKGKTISRDKRLRRSWRWKDWRKENEIISEEKGKMKTFIVKAGWKVKEENIVKRKQPLEDLWTFPQHSHEIYLFLTDLSSIMVGGDDDDDNNVAVTCRIANATDFL